GDIHFGEEISPESEAKTLNKKAILGGVGVAALVLVTAISSNHFSKENAGDKPLGNHGIASAATPADQLPEKYSDIEKQQKKNPPGSQSRTDQRWQVPAEPRMQVPVSSTPSSRGSQPVNLVPSEPTRSGAANPSISEAEKKAAKEAEAVNDSELAFRIAAAVSRGEPVAESQSLSNAGPMAGNRAVMTSTNVQGYGDYGEDVQGSYILNAGAVIQATLLTGITSDIPNGDVIEVLGCLFLYLVDFLQLFRLRFIFDVLPEKYRGFLENRFPHHDKISPFFTYCRPLSLPNGAFLLPVPHH
ncbi:MAG: hypothetical protein II687_03025, partial [Selenomonadaceae bacterium]|nr:hypothetical protein [Selenomonadaceae bacterium]